MRIVIYNVFLLEKKEKEKQEEKRGIVVRVRVESILSNEYEIIMNILDIPFSYKHAGNWQRHEIKKIESRSAVDVN